MSENKPRLSVIIPAYNEERRIQKTLRLVSEYLSRQNYTYEIIVVNDGSQDRTTEVVKEFSGFIKNLRLIDNKVNRGKGAVVKQGMLEAEGEIRLFMDADNSTEINHLEKMFPEFDKGSDVVMGSRRASGAVIEVHQSFFRENLGRVFNLIMRMIICLPYQDTQAGFKAFSSRAAEEIFSRQTIERFAFDVEVLVIARRLGFVISEIPLKWVNDPKSHVKMKGAIQMLFEIAKVRANIIFGKYNTQQ